MDIYPNRGKMESILSQYGYIGCPRHLQYKIVCRRNDWPVEVDLVKDGVGRRRRSHLNDELSGPDPGPDIFLQPIVFSLNEEEVRL